MHLASSPCELIFEKTIGQERGNPSTYTAATVGLAANSEHGPKPAIQAAIDPPWSLRVDLCYAVREDSERNCNVRYFAGPSIGAAR
jgi:hypothetical protein